MRIIENIIMVMKKEGGIAIIIIIPEALALI